MKKGTFKSHCIHGHVRTADTVDKKNGCCITCRSLRTKKWNQSEHGRKIHAEYNKGWAQRNPEKILNINLKRMYGITLTEYNLILEAQKGLCAVCTKVLSSRSQFGPDRPVVDHRHHDSKVRGILCSNCNCGIGLLQDDPLVLEKAAEYLKK